MSDIRIRNATGRDTEAIAGIYNHYVHHSTATFEEQPVTPEALIARISEVETASLPWLVAETHSGIAGYAYASKWKGRCAYRHSVETTVYIDPKKQGRGIGTQLYTALLDRLRERGMHAAIGGIALPNAASIVLHERSGFEKVAHFHEVGHKFGRWIDVGYWEIILS